MLSSIIKKYYVGPKLFSRPELRFAIVYSTRNIGVYVLTSRIDKAPEKLIVDECCNQYNSVLVAIANLHSNRKCFQRMHCGHYIQHVIYVQLLVRAIHVTYNLNACLFYN